jgi:hypothetical protein
MSALYTVMQEIKREEENLERVSLILSEKIRDDESDVWVWEGIVSRSSAVLDRLHVLKERVISDAA